MSRAALRVPGTHPCLPGHFPGHPLVPGVVILDRVVAAIEAEHGPLGALRLPQTKFVQPLLPDEEAEIAFEPATATEGRRWRFRVERAGILLASGELVAADAPR
ncbi:hypothetical protein [Luteimonas deserti]|uniref:ApeI dehydratase-like domain-containing protein n=1 Tax=Luteimonas deserti TaxID=2752306 RepID=A0A7Z0TXC0_9GAMM|nr:hypothetical protein [Luteimonas deserti]NYZ61192.1 hypothetical protein [Luteimonas deserti]